MPVAPKERSPLVAGSASAMAEARRAWENRLAGEVGVTVRIVFNRARTEPVRWTWERPRGSNGLIEIRLHEHFIGAPDEVRSALASWIRAGKRARKACATLDRWIAQNIATLPRKKRNERMRTRGDHHDLSPLADELYPTAFAEDFTDPASRPRVTWGRRTRSRSRGSLRLGSYDPEDNIVRIHAVLDRSSVPSWFVRYVLFHEILHAALPPRPRPGGSRWIHHGPDFRRRERLYVDYAQALEWEEIHLPRLIRAARRITPARSSAPAPAPAPRQEPASCTNSVIRWLQGRLF